jgi:hypothetical protein
MTAIGFYRYLIWTIAFGILAAQGCAGNSSTVTPNAPNTTTPPGAVSDPGKPPEDLAPSAHAVKAPEGNPPALLPPTGTVSGREESVPGSAFISQPPPSEGRSRYRLAIFPFWLSRGRDFAQYNYIDKFFEPINRVLDVSGVFIPVYSVYDLKNKFGTKIITNDCIWNKNLNEICIKSGSADLNKDLAILMGKILGVDAILICKVYSEPYSHGYDHIWLVDYQLDRLVTYLLDVHTKKVYRNESRNVASSLKQLIKEFKHDHLNP